MNRDLKLSKRLSAIASLVENASSVADIGTDHGYIPNFLIENNLAKTVYATDISADSLKKNIDMVKLRGNGENIVSLVGNGLIPVEDREVDTVIIAGMGGMLIMNILERSLEFSRTVKRFILQPQSSSYELREYLYKNEFSIVRELIVEDSNKMYEILLVENGHSELEDNLYLKYGKNLIADCDEVFLKYIEIQYESIESILDKLYKNRSERNDEKIAELKIELKELGEILNGCKSGRRI